MKIIFDYNRTLFDPETDSLCPGVLDLLQNLSQKGELSLVTRNEPGRSNKFDTFKMRDFFTNIAFVDEKTTELFKKIGEGADIVFVVGDRLKGEIRLGNQLGFITVWVKQGKFSFESPSNKEEEPHHIIHDIRDLENLISTYEI